MTSTGPETTTSLYPSAGIEVEDVIVIVVYFAVILAVGIWVSQFLIASK